MLEKPKKLPKRPNFSCGPCVKRPGWSLDNLKSFEVLGRSHRSQICLNYLNDVIKLTKETLDIPEDFKVAIVPGIAFGKSPYFRISYATSLNDLKSACEQIKNSIAKIL